MSRALKAQIAHSPLSHQGPLQTLSPDRVDAEWRGNWNAYLARDAARDARIDDALEELAESTRVARAHPNYGVTV